MRSRAALSAMAAALLAPAAARPPAAPGLNHVYAVLDRTTFDALRTSTALAALLGPGDTGLPAYAPPTMTADRFFLRGRRTYLEFYAPGNRFGEPVGKVGVGIGVDDPAGFRRIELGWRRACAADLSRERIDWTQTKPAIPWYDALHCGAGGDDADPAVWAMMYRPEFGRWLTGERRVDRRAMLASRNGRFDVVGLTLEVATAAYPSLVSRLSAAGFRRRPAGAGVSLSGDGFSMTLLPVAGRSRLRAIDVAISATGRPRLRLGAAHLVVPGAGEARLRFDRP